MDRTSPYHIPLERRIAFKAERGNQRREWLEARHRHNPRCRYCRLTTELRGRGYSSKADHSTSRHATIDHIIPVANGGVDRPSNWALSCSTCNLLKGDMPEAEFVGFLRAEGIRD